MATLQTMFDGWVKKDVDLSLSRFDSDATFATGSVPQTVPEVRGTWGRFFGTIESQELEFTATTVRVLSGDAAVVQGTYECTAWFTDGDVTVWPGNVTVTAVVERFDDQWKIVMGGQTIGTGVRIDHLFGVYDWAEVFSAALPNESYTDGTLEWRPDGTWTTTVNRADGSDPYIREGGSTFASGDSGCIAFTAWDNRPPEEPFTGTICEGVLTGDDGTFLGNQRG